MMKKTNLFVRNIYCIDTSSLINLKPYWKDVFPAIWTRLENLISFDALISPSEVFNEIEVGQDEITDWCKKNKKMFKDLDECQHRKIPDIKNKYNNKSYWETEMNKERWADPWVIALAICEDAIIVADEKNRVDKIPFIANKFNVKCINLKEFFREIGIKY